MRATPGIIRSLSALAASHAGHSSAINRRPHVDFERPVMLAMLTEGMRKLETTQAELAVTRRQLEEATPLTCPWSAMNRLLPKCRPEPSHPGEAGRRPGYQRNEKEE